MKSNVRIKAFYLTIFFFFLQLNLILGTSFNNEIPKDKKQIKQQVDSLYSQALKHYRTNEDSSLFYIDEIEELNNEFNDNSIWFNCQIFRAGLYNRNERFTKSDSLYQLMKKRKDKVPEDRVAFFHYSLGIYYEGREMIDSSIYYFQTVVNSLDTSFRDYHKLKTSSYSNLVILYNKSHQEPKSLEIYRGYESYISNLKSDSVRNIEFYKMHSNKALFYKKIGDCENSLASYDEAMKYSNNTKDSVKNIFNRIGVYERMKDQKQAIIHARMVLDSNRYKRNILSDKVLIFSNYILFQYHIEQKDEVLSQYYLDQMTMYVNRSKRSRYDRELMLAEAIMLNSKSAYEEAIEKLVVLKGFYEEKGDKYIQTLNKVNRYLIDSEVKRLGNNRLENYLDDYMDNQNIIDEKKEKTDLAKNLIAFETERKEIENEKLILEKQLAVTTISNQRYALIFGSIGAGLLGFLSFRLFQQSKKMKRNNTSLKHQRDKIQLLNREMNHRVKNNLSFMTSLLEMQGRRAETEEAKVVLKESESRLKALSLVHSNLFKNERNIDINLKTYLHEITSHLNSIFSLPDKELSIKGHFIDYDIDAEDAMRIGLIVNELVTNSVKHAFIHVNNPLIELETILSPEKYLLLRYKDNGPGIQEATLIENMPSKSMGLKLIELLKKQLHVQSSTSESEIIFTFK